jgi:hypothetical protein
MTDKSQTTTEHVLKTWPTYFYAIANGSKNFEVRRDDRGFQKGDILRLQCFDPKSGLWVLDGCSNGSKPKTIIKRISYILTGGHFGVEPGYVVMGLQDVESAENV